MSDAGPLPTFLVIGAMKAGTSSLYHYLRAHPQIFMPATKEPQFFATNWDRGLAWYRHLFEGGSEADAIGEASTEYSKYPHVSGVPARMSTVVPDARMVYLVRDPIERIVSEYQHRVGSLSGHEAGRSIDRAVLEDPSYCDFSRYAMQIEQYLGYFPRDRLLVIRSEDLREDRERTLRRVLSFIGVDDRWVPPTLQREFHRTAETQHHRRIDHALRRAPGYRALASIAPSSVKRLKARWMTRAAPNKPTLSEEVQMQLRERLRDDVTRLREYLDDGLDGWTIA